MVQNLLGRIAAAVASFIWPPANKLWNPFFKQLAKFGRSPDAIIGNVLGVAVGASVNHAHSTVNAIDFYLDDERKTERGHIIQLVQNNDNESDKLLLGYVSEAMRMQQVDFIFKLF